MRRRGSQRRPRPLDREGTNGGRHEMGHCKKQFSHVRSETLQSEGLESQKHGLPRPQRALGEVDAPESGPIPPDRNVRELTGTASSESSPPRPRTCECLGNKEVHLFLNTQSSSM